MSGFYYGWVIVAVSALANAMTWSVRSTFALFYVALLDEFGWRRGEAAVGLRVGRWEAFRAAPTLARPLDVWEVTPAGIARTARMHEATQHIQHTLARPMNQEIPYGQDAIQISIIPSKVVLAHAHLLAGDWDGAYHLGALQPVLGWSSGHNAQGLVVVCCLVEMSRAFPGVLPANLAQLWQLTLQPSTGIVPWHSADTGEARLLVRLQHAYAVSLPTVSWTSAQQHVTLLT